MNVHEAIRKAEALLPGEPVDEGMDPRWQAIIEVSEFIETEPEAIWEFVEAWGGHPQDDLRAAIATCLLEHLLGEHFDAIFPRAEQRALADPLFARMFLMCWKFGQTEQPGFEERFDALRDQLGLKGRRSF